ncbi:transglycosylase family protein [Nocardia sp. 348MFTsu5.1]|uniref:transglycosylase family protein n=1 Tax=Nocardia sp. 348MFTsu5.1 TaxID=1172185 RepID=UPI00036E432E|nr:transglycosylase family protein [Nocardia sp. 348MFTsu5.1]
MGEGDSASTGKLVAGALAVVIAIPMIILLAFTGSGSDCAVPQQAGASTLAPGSKVRPMKQGTYQLTSPFGPRGGAMHQGQDYGSTAGQPIYAAADGTVAKAGEASGFGQWIVLDHNAGGHLYSTVYGHMFPDGVLVREGDKVTAGQHIADVGYNGQVDPAGPGGAHLHFEVWDGGRFGGSAIDPMPWLAAAVDPGQTSPATGGAPAPPGAVSVADWDKIAQHESGGDWAINSGNGFYGGLQFTEQTWNGFGGGKYAPTADKAAKNQQMEVANSVLAGQGWDAWPTTSVQAGVRDKKPAPAGTFAATPDPGAPTAPAQPLAPAAVAAPDTAGGDLNTPMDAAKGSEEHWQTDTIRLARAVALKFPQVKTIGGWRPVDSYPDHPSGRAADIMIPNFESAEGKTLGDAINKYILDNKDFFQIEYTIWRQHYTPAHGEGNQMEDRGSPTQNHFDHVHVTTIGHGFPLPGTDFGKAPAGGGTSSSDECARDTHGGEDNLAAGTVPTEFEPWYRRAGTLCRQISSALLAAQGKQESGFNPKAVSGSGAEGIAQFMPHTWPSYGQDDDGNGTASAFDPGDAIMAQGRYMCTIAAQVDGWIADGSVNENTHPGGREALYLAAYNAGEGAVQRNHGFPTDSADYINQTKPYADTILATKRTYETQLSSTSAAPTPAPAP